MPSYFGFRTVLIPLAVSFLLVPPAEGIGPPFASNNDPLSAAEKAKIEAELAAAIKKLRTKHSKKSVETTVTIFPLSRLDVKEAAKLLQKRLKHRPGFAVATVPSLSLLIIRADAKTKEEARTLLIYLQ